MISRNRSRFSNEGNSFNLFLHYFNFFGTWIRLLRIYLWQIDFAWDIFITYIRKDRLNAANHATRPRVIEFAHNYTYTMISIIYLGNWYLIRFSQFIGIFSLSHVFSVKDLIVASFRVYKFHNGIPSMHEWIRYHYRSRHTFQQVSYSGKLLPKKKFEDICLLSHAYVWTCQRLMTIITMFKIKMQFLLKQYMHTPQPYWYNKMSCAHIKRLFCSYHTKVQEDFTLNNTTVL